MQVWGTIFAHVLWLVSTVSLTHPSPYEGWKDAEYCATLERIQTYAIPSVFNTSRVAHTKSNLRLIQVQVVARHGARAPYYNVFCWDKESSPLVEQEWQCGPTAVTVRFASQNIDAYHLTDFHSLKILPMDITNGCIKKVTTKAETFCLARVSLVDFCH